MRWVPQQKEHNNARRALLPTTEHELQSLLLREVVPLTDQQLHDYRLRCGDYEYYKILSTERLLKELKCNNTLRRVDTLPRRIMKSSNGSQRVYATLAHTVWIKRMSILLQSPL